MMIYPISYRIYDVGCSQYPIGYFLRMNPCDKCHRDFLQFRAVFSHKLKEEKMDIANIQARLDSLYEELFDVIMLDEWTAFDHDDQIALREAMNTGYSVFGIVFRQAFDSAVWAGWK